MRVPGEIHHVHDIATQKELGTACTHTGINCEVHGYKANLGGAFPAQLKILCVWNATRISVKYAHAG